mgnify:CR=1 FL=1
MQALDDLSTAERGVRSVVEATVRCDSRAIRRCNRNFSCPAPVLRSSIWRRLSILGCGRCVSRVCCQWTRQAAEHRPWCIRGVASSRAPAVSWSARRLLELLLIRGAHAPSESEANTDPELLQWQQSSEGLDLCGQELKRGWVQLRFAVSGDTCVRVRASEGGEIWQPRQTLWSPWWQPGKLRPSGLTQ